MVGLRYVGQHVNEKVVKNSSIVERYFERKASYVTRTAIGDALLQYVGQGPDEEGKGTPKDIARLYVLFVFNCILFPLTYYQTPVYVITMWIS